MVVRWAQISTSDERQSVACRGPHVQKAKLLAAADGADRAALARGFADVLYCGCTAIQMELCFL